MEALFEQERVENIKTIMPRLQEHVRVNDIIVKGLEGDPLYEWHSQKRPVGKVKSLRRTDTGLDVVADFNGKLETLSSGSLKPGDTWEFEDSYFSHVLDRNSKSKVSSNSSSYRGSENDMMLRLEELEKKCASLTNQLKESKEQVQTFSSAVVDTLGNMASDISEKKTDFSANFSRTHRSLSPKSRRN